MSDANLPEGTKAAEKSDAAVNLTDMSLLGPLIAAAVLDDLDAPVTVDEYIQMAQSEIDALQEKNKDLANDDVNRANLKLMCLILAFYRCGRAWLNQDELLNRIHAVLAETFVPKLDEYIERRFGVRHDRPDESFDKISENYLERGRKGFGAGFTFEKDRQTNTEAFFNITNCFFNNFFRRNNAPEVTRIMCALDMIWADALTNGDHNVRFDRPTIMSRGDDKCRFQFTRTD